MKTMVKHISVALLTLMIVQGAWAKQLTCTGSYQGQVIKIIGNTPSISLENASVVLTIDGAEMANFERNGINFHLLSKTFKLENSHGDLIEGAFDNFMAGLATLSIINVHGRFTYSNVKVRCKTK